MKIRHVVLLAGLAAGAVMVADVLLWRMAQSQLAAGWNAWITTARAQGWTVSAGQSQQGGWPLVATRTVPELIISGDTGDLPGGLTWSTDQIVLQVNLLHPRTLAIASDGMQRLRLGELPDIPYTADALRAAVPLAPGVPVRSVSLRAVNLRAGLPGGAATVAGLALQLAWTPAAQQNEPAIELGLEASEVGLPPGPVWPLGPRIAKVDLDGALGGPLPLVSGLAARAAAWRDGGGAADVKRLEVTWGPLKLSATATLALDEAMQPMGTGTARINGADATLDALVATRAIGERTAVAAKALLALMAHPGADEVDVPVTVQDRRVALGRIPLAKLPMITWEQ